LVWGASLVQRKHPTPEHFNSSFAFNLLAGTALTLLCFLGAPFLADLFGAFDLSLILQVLSFSILITSFRFVQEAILKQKTGF
jgi:O-antigen/teichoic acid export membrane protein